MKRCRYAINSLSVLCGFWAKGFVPRDFIGVGFVFPKAREAALLVARNRPGANFRWIGLELEQSWCLVVIIAVIIG